MAEKIRILHIEDNPLDAELIEAQLRSMWPDCDYALVCSESELSAGLDGAAIDVVLSDYSMPDFDGMSALIFVLRHSPEIPVIFVTGAMGEEKAVETLKSGATDYILKSHLEKLVPAVERVLKERKASDAQHKLEHQLVQVTREWQSTFDAISDSVALIDPDQRIVRCNRATTSMLGSDYAELINQPCWKLFHDADEPLPDCPMIAAKRSLHSERSTIRRDDRWLDVTVDPILSDSGELTGAVHIVRDVSERKRIEEELQKKCGEIEQFMYSVSHDLRSPLVTIKTFMGYLVQDMTAGNQEHLAQDIGYIHGAADKLTLLLDELLEMSRIGRIETPPVRAPLREVLQGPLNMLAGVISERRVEIVLPDSEVMLYGDLQRLHQLWQNLIENAIKYSSDGAVPRIELGVRQEDDETVFFVRDNGIGIDSHYLDKVFGVFEKLDPKSPGAGLGLSMIKRIVELYDGRVWVESEGVGRGACFSFTLPKAIAGDGGS
jgi:PAS domain S-box-containing protein